MKWKTLRIGILIAASLTLLVVMLPLNMERQFFAPDVRAQDGQNAISLPRSITVVGEGKVRIQPDIARVTIGVEVVRPSVQEASEENKQIVEQVLMALKEQGVVDKDVQTSGFSIWVERIGSEGLIGESGTRYHVTNSVTVIIRQIETVGSLLDAAIEAGANNMYGIEFKLQDPSAAESTARQAAIANARAKADELASLTDVSLGDVVTVSEIIGAGGGFYTGSFTEAVGYGGGGTSISPGELSVTKQLQVTYAIAD